MMKLKCPWCSNMISVTGDEEITQCDSCKGKVKIATTTRAYRWCDKLTHTAVSWKTSNYSEKLKLI